MDALPELRRFAKALVPLAEALGLDLSWHFVNQDHLLQVPSGQRQCHAPFCLQTRKKGHFTLDRCLKDHNENAFRQALLRREAFTMICHAGAKLLAVPLFAGDTLWGVLFVGPAAGNPTPAYPEMADDYRALPVRGEKELLALGRYLAAEFAWHFGDAVPPEAGCRLIPRLSSADTRVLKAAHLMRLRRRGKVSAGTIAAECGVGVSTLLHIFRRETGFSFRDWLLRLRVSDAQSLIEGTDLAFSEIALKCGFSDQSRMTVLVKRYLRRTPSELRRAAAPRAHAADA